MQQKRFSEKNGFTLIELLVSIVIVLIFSSVIFKFLADSTTGYHGESSIALAMTDFHIASNLISRELESAGFGVPGGLDPVTIGEYGGFDKLTVRGCFGEPAHLTSDLSSGDGIAYLDDASRFAPWDYVLIGEIENNSVENVGDDYIELTNSTDHDFPSGSTVRKMDTVEYYVDGGVLYRKEDSGNPQPILEHVVSFQIEPHNSTATLYTLTLGIGIPDSNSTFISSFSVSRRVK